MNLRRKILTLNEEPRDLQSVMGGQLLRERGGEITEREDQFTIPFALGKRSTAVSSIGFPLADNLSNNSEEPDQETEMEVVSSIIKA